MSAAQEAAVPAARQKALLLLDAAVAPGVPADLAALAATTAGGVDTLALAWALKALCYEAWNTDPPRAALAAQVLATLPTAGLPPDHAGQVQGLAAWTYGIASVVQGQMAQAVAAFDRAQALLSQAGQPDAAAQTQVPKIMALCMLGQPDQATACAEQAQVALLALGNVAAASRVSLNLGSLLLTRDAYAESARHYRQAAVWFARLGDALHSVLADIGLAGALAAMGDFDEALRIYARVRMRASAATAAEAPSQRLTQPMTQPLAMVDSAVALLDLARGRYSEALAGLERVRQAYVALGLPHALVIAERQLADAYLDLRLLPEALALYDAVVARCAQLQLPEEQAWALAQRGRVQALLGRVAAARDSFAAAAALFGESHHAVGLSSVTLALAELALAQGQAPVALQQAQAAVAGFADASHADGQARAEVICAQALWQAGQGAAAEAAFARTLQGARQRQQLQVQVRCLTGQGVAALAGGRVTQAEQALEAAIELLEDQRRALPGDELRSAFLTEHLRPYQERLRMALAGGDAAVVLLQLERSKARSLTDRLDEAAPEAGQPQPAAAELVADSELRERLNWLYRRVQQLQDEGEQSPVLQQELLRSERELLERARRRRLTAAGGEAGGEPGSGLDGVSGGAPGGGLAAGGAAATAAVDLPALQRALGPADALVEYGVLDDELFALVVTQGRVLLQRRLASWAQVAQTLQSARFQIETLRHGVAPVQAHLAAINQRTRLRLAQLHALVWAPLQLALAGVTRVLVVPHAQLSALPFCALQAGLGDDAAGVQPVQLALDQPVQLAQVPSARAALRGLLRQPLPAVQALVLGESSRLPHAAREAQFVAGLFARSVALVGSAATLAAVQAQAAQADVIHLACHAQFRSDNPRFSALHLADGALTAELTETLRLRAGTVVLSACESGLSEEGGGDEMVGLVRAFLVAGAARVLATLWPVDDEVTADFMAHFYGALVAGRQPSQALLQAQAALRLQHPEPYFWAAFTLYGGW